MIGKLLIPEIKELIENKQWDTLKKFLEDPYPSDIADLIQDFDEVSAAVLFRLLSKESAFDVFAEMEPEFQGGILKQMSSQYIKEIISELEPDVRTKLFEELPGNLTQNLLNLLPAEERKEALAVLAYPENSVGRLITPDYIAVRPDWKVEKVFIHIRRREKDAETIDRIYIVNDEWRLLDDIPVKRFIFADPQQKVKALMDGRFISLSAYEDQEVAIRIMKKYNLVALPVTDSGTTMIGIVTIDDIMDVMEEETTEDFHKTAAVAPLEKNYTASSPLYLYKKRVPWLLFLLIAGFLSSSVIAHYENSIQLVIVLAFFIPVLTGAGGNTASQAAAIVIRALALGEIDFKDWFRVIKKEVITGILLALTLGVILFLWGTIWKGGTQIGIVVGLSMIGIILWANLIGSLLPIILTKLKLDPAVISSPFLATLLDASGLLLYFSIAKIILQ